MKADAKENIFKPFVRLDNDLGRNGLGLGLSLCKSIVDQHKGEIEVESKLGEGTLFTISLPLARN